MEEFDNELTKIIEDFDQYVKDFTESGRFGVPELDSTVEDLFDLSHDDILSLTSQQCSAKSFKIDGYAMYVRSQLNQNKARLNWCEDYINRILAKAWNQYDPYMKYELKRQAIICDNDLAPKLEKLRSRLQARQTVLEDKLIDIRHMSETLAELGRRKAYNERS